MNYPFFSKRRLGGRLRLKNTDMKRQVIRPRFTPGVKEEDEKTKRAGFVYTPIWKYENFGHTGKTNLSDGRRLLRKTKSHLQTRVRDS